MEIQNIDITLPPVQLHTFDKLIADITLKTAPSLQIVVKDTDSMNAAKLAGKEILHYTKLNDTAKETLNRPLLDRQKLVNDSHKKIQAILDGVKTHLKNQLLTYENALAVERKKELDRIEKERREKQLAQEKERQEQEKKLAEQKKLAEAFGLEEDQDQKRLEIIEKEELDRKQSVEMKILRQEEKAIISNAVSGVRKTWKFEVTSMKDIPFEFLTVDQAKVKEFMMTRVKEKVHPVINGVRFYQEESVAL